MSAPSGSGNPSTSKAVPSLTKRPSTVTRQGTQKLKFVPTLPARRKKEEPKTETPDASSSSTDSKSTPRGQSKARGGGASSSDQRGKPPVTMTASGPFAMGPALAGTSGSSSRRPAPRSNFAPVMPSGGPSNPNQGLVGLSSTGKEGKVKVEEAEYSDPEDGVEIVDMQQVRTLDWMAPESLKKEIEAKKSPKEKVSDDPGDVDLSNAIDMSESEDEEEMEDIIDDFEMKADLDSDSSLRQDRLYFFQFPSPFPTFESPPDLQSNTPAKKVVTFASDVKPDESVASQQPVDGVAQNDDRLDGIIGQLEIYRSGAVKMRLKNGILLEVNAATQPSFLQQATYLDWENKQLVVLGEVNKQFVLTPDVDTLLSAMDQSEKQAQGQSQTDWEEQLISMDN